jgi:hypothetical protein
MSSFDAFLKKKKDNGEKAAKKPKAEPESEPVIEAETVDEESETSSEQSREDDTKEEIPKPSPSKPIPKPSVSKPESAATKTKVSVAPKPPIAGAAPSSQSAPYSYTDLASAVQISDFGDDYDSEGYGDKVSITVVGEKGEGKSTLALAFSGSKLVISYDRMAKANKYKMRDPENIKIIDPMPIFDSSSATKKRDSMARIYEYLVGVEEYPNGPRVGGLLNEHEPVDWIIHDGTDILMEICEMVMRAKHDLLPAQGVEWNLWKDRKYAIQDVYHKSLSLARKGVIFTTYFDEKSYDEDITGQKKKKQLPKWMDIILHQTLHTLVPHTQGENFFLFVAQSKSVKKDVTRKTFDITGVSYESEEVDEKGVKVWKMDFTKLYEAVEELEREVF